jgi:translation initiation factor 4A
MSVDKKYTSNFTDVRESFDDFGFNDDTLRGIYAHGASTPAPIQQKIAPLLEGQDAIMQAHSGSGKTLAFSLVAMKRIRQKITVGDKERQLIGPQIIVLSHTHDLASQTYQVMKDLTQFLPDIEIVLCIGSGEAKGKDYQGKNSVNQNIRAIENARTPQILVGTPGRVKHLLEYKSRNGKHLICKQDINLVVLDEADELLKRNFKNDIYNIFSLTNREIQICLFSATMPREILQIADEFMRDPLVVLLEEDNQTLAGIEQLYINLGKCTFMDKVDTLCDLFEGGDISIAQCIIFCNEIKTAEELEKVLTTRDFTVSLLHGKMSESDREKILKELRDGSTRIVIASDYAARGINVQGIQYVFHFDLCHDKENFLHRSGRSGRFLRSGKSLVFLTNNDYEMASEIEKEFKFKMEEFKM